ncbi:MAG: hypothetical protein J7J76_01605 [Candidatus Latescibacteria bacterium]|nr:hypothetical protein [Candidatus Latescibacterota bacterium]
MEIVSLSVAMTICCATIYGTLTKNIAIAGIREEIPYLSQLSVRVGQRKEL